jgi:hypothetical protein
MANNRNLKPWKPGQSGNPGGRPKRQPLTEAFLELMDQPYPQDRNGRTYAEAIVRTLATKAARGDVRAAQLVMERIEGRVPIAALAESSGPVGLTIEMIDELVHGDLEDDDASDQQSQ